MINNLNLNNRDPNQIVLWRLNGDPNNYGTSRLSLDRVGAPNFIMSQNSPQGFYSLQGEGDLNYLQASSNARASFSIIIGAVYSIEFYIRFTSYPQADNIPWAITTNGAGLGDIHYFNFVTTLGVAWGTNGNGIGEATIYPFTPTLNTWYYCRLTWDGVTKKIYFDDAKNITETVRASSSLQDGTYVGSIDSILVNRYVSANTSYRGNLSNLKFTNKVLTKFSGI